MKTISRYIMTLALLLTAVTGAWAQSYEAKVFDVPALWTEDNTLISAADLPKDFVQITKDEAKALAVPDGPVVLVYGFNGENVLMMAFDNGTAIPDDDDGGNPEARGQFIVFQTIVKATVCYTTPAGPTVAWDASTKSGTFAMPGSDVVLTPIYAKAAAFATTGTGSEAKTLLPAAAEGVIAGTDAPLIADGTGIVANITGTETAQGTLMYAISTSATEAPAPTAFSATVPTAENVADDGADVLVWYYIQGADAPESEAATLDNTFDDTEPACLTVQVLTNKFDITLNAANANTIEAGKATVTVGGTDKTAEVTDGKLQGVKMGSEVKLEAKPGYKFRKVEVKKGAAAARPLAEAVAADLGKIAGADGNIYDTKAAAEAANTTAVAMIAYVGSGTDHATYTHGLAIALADESSEMNWSTAKSTCEGKTAVSGAAWLLPSQNQWKAMFKANGGNEDSYSGLNSSLATAGGTALQENGINWSSTEKDDDNAYDVYFAGGVANWYGDSKDYNDRVRACLAF